MWKWFDDAAFIVALALVGGAVLALFVMPAKSEELMGFHSQHHHGRLHDWYSRLMRPDNPNVSCCSSRDCTPTRARLQDGAWFAMRNGVWVKVPPEKINREESLDSQAHICFPPYEGLYAPGHIFCFVIPGIAG